MKQLVFILVFLLAVHAFAGPAILVEGEGRFYAEEGDSLGFVKSQLVAKATKDLISKEMRSLGYDVKIFWERYDLAFQNVFKQEEQELKVKHNLNAQSSEEQIKKIKKILREERLSREAKFGNIEKALDSYSIKTLNASPENARSKGIVILAQVNSNYVTELYRRYVTGEAKAKHDKIYFSVRPTLEGEQWKNIGANYSHEIIEPLNKLLKSWAVDEMGHDIDSVIFSDEKGDEDLEEKLSLADNSSLRSSAENAVWVKLNLRITTSSENSLLNEQVVSIKGDYLSTNLNTKSVVFVNELSPVTDSINKVSDEVLREKVVQLLFQASLPSLLLMRDKLKDQPKQVQFQNIVVNESGTMTDLLDFMSYIKTQLTKFRPELTLDTYSQERSEIMMRFQGEPHDLKNAFIKIKDQAMKNGKKILFLNEGNPFNVVIATGKL